jgi:hypothetical protein
MTLAQLCDLYLTEGLATRKATSIASARGNIENHTKPLLGAKRASLQSQQRLLGALGLCVAANPIEVRSPSFHEGADRLAGLR